jgi:hypothetical protein
LSRPCGIDRLLEATFALLQVYRNECERERDLARNFPLVSLPFTLLDSSQLKTYS